MTELLSNSALNGSPLQIVVQVVRFVVKNSLPSGGLSSGARDPQNGSYSEGEPNAS
jgi:hypothetical protein